MVEQAIKPVPDKTYTPVGKKVALHVYLQNMTDGGLSLPDGSTDWRTPICLVIAIGPEVTKVKEGDRVLMHNSTPALKVKHRGNETVMVLEDDICGIED